MSAAGLPDFATFYGEVHGRDPFPWQVALADKVLADGWAEEERIDVPTGLGKTSVIDVVVFALAADAPGAGRRMPTRTLFVVDRRLVVDDVSRHAHRLAEALRTSRPGSAAHAVAGSLRALGGLGPDDAPLEVVRMRGGLSWSWRWLATPDRPAVVVTTVDQFGSRLLFRGYGVGRHLRPIDAALVGTDVLVVVDEAHLAGALLETLRAARAFQRSARSAVLAGRDAPRLVVMSATGPGTTAHTVTDADRRHPEAGRRLGTRKLVRLVQVGHKEKLAGLLARLALQLAEDGPTRPAVAVVCNTVARARAVHEILSKASPDPVDLLIGRAREPEREALLEELLPAIGTGRPRPGERRRFVVATQTIEVGADLDFDVLVSEAAPADALVQRLGRLDRVGDLAGTGRAAVAYCPGVHDDDPVYGEATARTWKHLVDVAGCPPVEISSLPAKGPVDLGHAQVDLGPEAAMRLRSDPAWDSLVCESPRAPVLLGVAHLDRWVRTGPEPAVDAPVGPFLHGLEAGTPEVSVAWRADLDPALSDTWAEKVEAVPVLAAETVTVPLWELRAWMAAKRVDQGADLEGTKPGPHDEEGEGRNEEVRTGRAVLRLGPEGPEVCDDPSRIRPGDLVVCPSSLGGLDRFGWNPEREDPVADVADLVAARARLRLCTATLESLLGAELHDDLVAVVEPVLAAAQAGELGEAEVREALGALATLCGASPDPLAGRLGEVAHRLAGHPVRFVPLFEGERVCCVLVRARASVPIEAMGDDEPDSSSTGPAPVGLHDHLAHVRHRAESIARRLGMDDRLVAAVALAAEAHDLGKADPRFQVMLHGGDTLAAEAGRLLAKSGTDPADRRARRIAWERSGLPEGFRHEDLSARLVADWLGRNGAADLDADLVVHLVAAHHGRSRPVMPPAVDPDPPAVEVAFRGATVAAGPDPGLLVDWEAPARFRRLNERYGPWGLALLEAVVRLADIACSEEGG